MKNCQGMSSIDAITAFPAGMNCHDFGYLQRQQLQAVTAALMAQLCIVCVRGGLR